MERVHLQLAAFPRYGNTNNMATEESAVILVTSDTGELLKN